MTEATSDALVDTMAVSRVWDAMAALADALLGLTTVPGAQDSMKATLDALVDTMAVPRV